MAAVCLNAEQTAKCPAGSWLPLADNHTSMNGLLGSF